MIFHIYNIIIIIFEFITLHKHILEKFIKTKINFLNVDKVVLYLYISRFK